MAGNAARIKVANRLLALYPETFFETRPIPLKIGIAEDIIAENPLTEDGEPINKSMIRRFLRWYCNRNGYLKAIVHSDVRIDLQGKVTVHRVISNYEKEKALVMLKQKKEKWLQKTQASNSVKPESTSGELESMAQPSQVVHEMPENVKPMTDNSNRPILSLKKK